jgi:hypothetical protein
VVVGKGFGVGVVKHGKAQGTELKTVVVYIYLVLSSGLRTSFYIHREKQEIL